MEEYQHSKFSSPGRIRLLQLLPHNGRQRDVRGSLFETALRSSSPSLRPFEALSYCWGNPVKTSSITIVQNGKPNRELKVTENLYTALLHLQDHDIPRILWIDAVCIDQSNIEEKGHQIDLMAEIYAMASRVIVWLGESENDSDHALMAIQNGVGNAPEVERYPGVLEGPILALLKRPWFRRIWVLQEIAAAREILVMCGPVEINGHVLHLGLSELQVTVNQAALLMRGAMFRPRYLPRENERHFSLNIGSLAELLDLYHSHKATIILDKVYALLGMCSDGQEVRMAGIESDYSLGWKTLMERIIKYVFQNQATVNAWNENGMPAIKVRGQVVGYIRSKGTGFFNVTSKKSKTLILGSEYNPNRAIHSLAKQIQEGDIICQLQGSAKSAVIRLCEDHFEIIAIAVDPPEEPHDSKYVLWNEVAKEQKTITRDFQLVWDWTEDADESQDPRNYNAWTNVLKKSDASKESFGVRIWNVAQILGDSGQIQEADTRSVLASQIFEKRAKNGDSSLEDSQKPLMPLLVASDLGAASTVGCRLAEGDDPNSIDYSGRTPLGMASFHGHVEVVKLLLDAGADVNSIVPYYGRTVIRLAAERKHEAVIKLLLETGKVGNRALSQVLRDAAEYGQSSIVKILLSARKLDIRTVRFALEFAADNGHAPVVSLLLATGMIDLDAMWPALRYAAAKGHEAVIKLLLATGQVDPSHVRSLSRVAEDGGHEATALLLSSYSTSEAHTVE